MIKRYAVDGDVWVRREGRYDLMRGGARIGYVGRLVSGRGWAWAVYDEVKSVDYGSVYVKLDDAKQHVEQRAAAFWKGRM